MPPLSVKSVLRNCRPSDACLSFFLYIFSPPPQYEFILIHVTGSCSRLPSNPLRIACGIVEGSSTLLFNCSEETVQAVNSLNYVLVHFKYYFSLVTNWQFTSSTLVTSAEPGVCDVACMALISPALQGSLPFSLKSQCRFAPFLRNFSNASVTFSEWCGKTQSVISKLIIFAAKCKPYRLFWFSFII